jgi:putative phosphoribosyl transferase
MRFHDRVHAGRLLAKRLARFANKPNVLVCALPRGGVVVAAPVAEALDAPLDVVMVRKLGVPGQPELAMGAIASGGVRVLSYSLIDELGIPERAVEAVIAREEQELARREALYRGSAPPPQIPGQTVILVDDGIATGSTMRAAAALVRQQKPERLVIAIPVAPPATCAEMASHADEVVCVEEREPFYAIGEFYEEFRQVSDAEVRELLQRAAARIARKTRSAA